MESFLDVYDDFVIDFTPYRLDDGNYRARCTIVRKNAVFKRNLPILSCWLQSRGTIEQMAEVGRMAAIELIVSDNV